MPQVQVIQPVSRQVQKLKVAAYARVSSDSFDQLNSFTTQIEYYTSYIKANEEWEFAGLYADEAVSGTAVEKRTEFQRLMEDCRKGNVERILVKSISRFARNTLDCIGTVRELKQIKKNNGELPQYYIKDNHPAIIPREMFHQIQEEIARRNSKKPAGTRKSKTNRGKFTSKYALSERLVCGHCGAYYRRITWNIHGRKEIVWRCINRLENGVKVCGDSPSIKETELHEAILSAMRTMVKSHRTEMIETMKEALGRSSDKTGEGNRPIDIEIQLEKLDEELDQLLLRSGNEVIDLRIKQISDQMVWLKYLKKQAEMQKAQHDVQEDRINDLIGLIEAESMDLTEYSDALVYRIVERVTVLEKDRVRIRFVGGFEIWSKCEQPDLCSIFSGVN